MNHQKCVYSYAHKSLSVMVVNDDAPAAKEDNNCPVSTPFVRLFINY